MKRKITRKIIIHHSASPLMTTTLGMIRKWHKEKGFTDENGCCGYHFFIGADGIVIPDRPVDDWGCGVKNANHDAVHICLAGNFNIEQPLQDQINPLKVLLVQLCNKYGLKYWNIYGHRDIKWMFIFNTTQTDCPGTNLYKMLPLIRRWVGQQLGQING